MLLLIVPMSSGQAPLQQNCNLVELYNRAGWVIPGLSKATVKERVTITTRDNQKVSAEVLQPVDRGARLPVISCVPNHSGRVEWREQPIDVIEIRRYSIKGKVFAYRVSAEQVAVEGDRRVAIAAAEVVMFYDVDGSGRFTIREYATKIPYALRVPDWIANK